MQLHSGADGISITIPSPPTIPESRVADRRSTTQPIPPPNGNEARRLDRESDLPHVSELPARADASSRPANELRATPRSGSRERPSVGADEPASNTTPTAAEASLARFYMTSDLRAATGLTRTHLDFYLREGVIIPTARTESGYLLFDDDELAVLRQVIAWRHDGVGVRDIRVRLDRALDADTEGGSR